MMIDKIVQDSIEYMKKHGKVAFKIHPDHLEKIGKLGEEVDECKDRLDDAQKAAKVVDKEYDHKRALYWRAIEDSYDSVMKQVNASDECTVTTIEREEGKIYFKTNIGKKQDIVDRLRKLGITIPPDSSGMFGLFDSGEGDD